MNSIFLKTPFLIWLNCLQNSFRYKYRNKTIIIGNNVYIKESNFGIYNRISDCVSLFKTNVDSYTYIGKNSQVSRCKIGKFCSIGENVIIGLGKHPVNNFISTHPAFYTNKQKFYFSEKMYYQEYKNINVGSDVWIGNRVMISDGINIGDGAIIGAGSFVTKDVAPYSIVGGIPAKHIKYRFSENEIEELNNIKWWDWNIETIRSKYLDFHNVEFFIKKYKNQCQ